MQPVCYLPHKPNDLMVQAMSNTRQQRFFLLCYFLFFTAGILLSVSKGKAASFLVLNSFHRPWLDSFFIYCTNLGDGFFAVMLSLIFFFVAKEKKLGFVLFLAYASTGIIAQIIKPLIESPRPQVYFAPQWLPFFIKGVIHTGHSSFPSGHTATAFALAVVFAWRYSSKWLQLLLLLLAMLVGFSRVYLSQHFLADVLAGSFIGVAGGLLCIYLCRGIKEEGLVLKKKQEK